MAINIKFDLAGNPEPPTIILATRNGNKLGQLEVDSKSIDLTDKFIDASEFTFTLNKFINGRLTNLWDKVVDFKLVYCKEWDTYFEITVELDEKTETVKTVSCTQLGQAELSQIMLYGVEINTEKDIEREDYKISILCDEDNPKASILHRMLEKAPHYSIKYVDPTIKKIQRSFSFDGTSINDGFQEVAEEIGCFFDMPSSSGDFKKSIITEETTILYENLVNEQSKIEEWGLSEFGNAFDIKGNSFSQHKFGNVDMDNRIIITWSDSLKSTYSNALTSWNYNPEVGSIDTVFGGSSRFGESILETGIEVAYTPIVNTDGKAAFVSKSVLYNYIEALISESTVNGVCNKNTVLSLDNTGRYIDGIFIHGVIAAMDLSLNYENNGNWAETVGRLMHFSGKYGAVSLAQSDIIEYAENIGISFEEFIYVHKNGKGQAIRREISVYDLQQNCNDCGHRGEFIDICPKCGSKNIKYGYGKDTLIFVTSDELASDGIEFKTDTDSVKNCFKLEAGDDLMTATIRSRNPNGTDYIWYFSDAVKEDMSDELVSKIESYDELYKHQYNDAVSNVDAKLLESYNSLVDKYSAYNKDLQKISTPITGYSNLMNAYYNTIDLSLFLESALMPSVEISKTNAKEQVSLLTTSSLSPTAVADVSIVSLSTANSAVLAMAKVVVKSTFKVEIKSSELTTSGNKKYWKGNFVVTNYSDDEDAAESGIISVELNDDLETVTKQKIEKALKKKDTDDLSITGLFSKEYNDFCSELKKYALNPLISFRDACQDCIDILIDKGVGNGDTWASTESGSESNLYEKLYVPYYNKLMAIEAEVKVREDEINIIVGVYDTEGDLTVEGLQTNIEDCKKQIQSALNFEDYLGDELWLEFCAYRREDKYTNENYISDGLNNAELFEKALEFFEVAENEIYKSSELQHSISTTLNNLLAIPKFKPLIESFEVGNWIRVRVDDEIYKLRLLEYTISFSDFNNIPVEFSDVTKVKNGITDVENILSQASSMATSYDSIQRQAKQGNEAQETIEQWLSNGLNTALVQIQNNDSEDISISRNGLLGRSYNELTDTYSPEQFKLTHNIMAYTTDNWKTVSAALGKHEYTKWKDNQWVKDVDYGLSATFVTAGYVTGSQIIGGEIVSSNYKSGKSGTYFNLIDGDFEFAGGKIVFDTKNDALTLKGVTIEWDSSSTPEITDISGLSDYIEQLEQVDGRIQTYSQTTDPSLSWSSEEKKEHIGDLWINSDDGITKSWNGTSWVVVTDSILEELAQSKAQIFTATPTPPYYIGDLWVQGTTGDIMHCVVNKNAGQSFSASDWVKSSKYTDDTVAKEALEEAKKGIENAANAIQIANNALFNAIDAETNAKDYADEQDKSLSDTLTDAYQKYTNTNISTLDSYVAKYLGLGGNTIIGSNYVISPIIEGGYLNITNTNNNSRVIIDPNNLTGNGYIFQVHNGNKVTVGVKSNGNSEFSGTITASDFKGGSLLIGDKTSGKYAEITSDGILNCAGANITGTITATAGVIGGCNIVNGTLEIPASNIKNLSMPVMPSYIKSTYIGQTEIRSPTIIGGEFYGNEFNIISEQNVEGAFNLYGWDYNTEMFKITYWSSSSIPYVNIGSPAAAQINFGILGGNIMFHGNVSFSNAYVEGVTATFG